MKKKILNYTALLTCITIALTSCKKEEKTSEPAIDSTNGELTLNLENTVDGNPLILSKGASQTWYINQNNDSFYVTKFNYYITNISLQAEDGSIYKESDSYHLIEGDINESKSFTIKNIPAKKYISISYMIGVDSARNISGAQTGALDPANDMFWSWNSGYIFMKFEGVSTKSAAPNKSVIFHVGGYEGVNRGQRNATFNLPSPTLINGSNKKTVTLKTNVNELFKNPSVVNFNTFYFAMTNFAQTKIIADNYADMISFSKIE
jgi:hypothetical protein